MRRARPILILVCLFILSLSASSGAVMQKLATGHLVDRAESIVRGTVTEATAFDAGDGIVNTRIEVAVTDRLKGAAPDHISFVQEGGVLKDWSMLITDQPSFVPGQDVVLYLDQGCTHLVGRIQGKLTIQDGLVWENGLVADDYLNAVRDLSVGLTPTIELDRHFKPVSAIEAYVKSRAGLYAYDGMRWSGKNVKLSINENCSDTSGELDAVKDAMSSWTNVAADFKFTYDGSNSRTTYSQNYKNEGFWSKANPEGAIAVTVIWASAYIVECDLIFYDYYNWSAQGDPSYSEMDVENIAVHELGHFLSLLDLYGGSDSDKTMYGYAGEGETKKRSLHQDDKNGIIHIYGSGPGDDDDDDDDDDNDDNDDNGDDDDDDDRSDKDCENVCNKLVTCGHLDSMSECQDRCDDLIGSIFFCVMDANNCQEVDECLGGSSTGDQCESICSKLYQCDVIKSDEADSCRNWCEKDMGGDQGDCLNQSSVCSEVRYCMGVDDGSSGDDDDDDGLCGSLF